MNGIHHGSEPAYQYARSPGRGNPLQPSPSSQSESISLDYSHVDSESYTALGGASSLTGFVPNYHNSIHDATDTVREMYLALLYLLSNPEEFHRALQVHPAQGATTLAEWNVELETESMVTGVESTVSNSTGGPTPLPYVVFADDAEVVLPQAHTASQLFGLERIEGIELEAAAGVPSLSQLFLRWLALMPSGDHMNLIDPPGLTVMRIAGGRYRVTAAHRVVWTWMNEFAAFSEAHGNDEVQKLEVGDLVSMTIVDVFETDNQGKLLSYCPTFDNRAVHKTNPATETIRKSSSKFFTLLGKVQNSRAAKGLMSKAKTVAYTMKHKMDEAAANYSGSPPRRETNSDVGSSVTAQAFEEALNAAETAAVGPRKREPGSPPTANDCSSDDTSDTPTCEPVKGVMTNKDSGGAIEMEDSEQQRDEYKGEARSEAYISDSDEATHDDEI